jgi:hypothetical protein
MSLVLREKCIESNNSGNLGESKRRTGGMHQGRMKNEIKHQGDSLITPLDAIEA